MKIRHLTPAQREHARLFARRTDARIERASGIPSRVNAKLGNAGAQLDLHIKLDHTQCPECGRWNYHLATCSRRPMP